MEDIIKVISVLASLFVIYKIVVDVVLAKSTRRRDEYKFTKEYIIDLQKGEEHTYSLEKGFFALTGEVYSVAEINILLSQKSPSRSINLRSDSHTFLEFDEASHKYRWKGKYSTPLIRKHTGKWYFSWYLITASIAISPLYIKGISNLITLPIPVIATPLFLIAIYCLLQQSNFYNTLKFMDTLVYKDVDCIDLKSAA